MAVYAFGGDKEDELAFEEGDLIVILDKPEGGWWQGECNGRVCVWREATSRRSIVEKVRCTRYFVKFFWLNVAMCETWNEALTTPALTLSSLGVWLHAGGVVPRDVCRGSVKKQVPASPRHELLDLGCTCMSRTELVNMGHACHFFRISTKVRMIVNKRNAS